MSFIKKIKWLFEKDPDIGIPPMLGIVQGLVELFLLIWISMALIPKIYELIFYPKRTSLMVLLIILLFFALILLTWALGTLIKKKFFQNKKFNMYLLFLLVFSFFILFVGMAFLSQVYPSEIPFERNQIDNVYDDLVENPHLKCESKNGYNVFVSPDFLYCNFYIKPKEGYNLSKYEPDFFLGRQNYGNEKGVVIIKNILRSTEIEKENYYNYLLVVPINEVGYIESWFSIYLKEKDGNTKQRRIEIREIYHAMTREAYESRESKKFVLFIGVFSFTFISLLSIFNGIKKLRK